MKNGFWKITYSGKKNFDFWEIDSFPEFHCNPENETENIYFVVKQTPNENIFYF